MYAIYWEGVVLSNLGDVQYSFFGGEGHIRVLNTLGTCHGVYWMKGVLSTSEGYHSVVCVCVCGGGGGAILSTLGAAQYIGGNQSS